MYWRGPTPSRDSRGEFLLWVFQLLCWLVVTSYQCLPLWSHHTMSVSFALCQINLCFALLRTHVLNLVPTRSSQMNSSSQDTSFNYIICKDSFPNKVTFTDCKKKKDLGLSFWRSQFGPLYSTPSSYNLNLFPTYINNWKIVHVDS